MKKSIIATTFVVMSLTGCKSTEVKTNLEGLYTAQSFTHQSISQSKISIGGIAYSGDQMTRFNTPALQMQDFEKKLRDQRPAFKVVPSVALKQSIPTDVYQQVMEEYKTSNTLKPASLQILAEHNYPRYVVFTNILTDNVTNSRSEFEAKEEVDGENVNLQKVKAATDRRVSARTHIFDLQSASMVWSGSVSKNKSAYNTYVKLAQAATGEDKAYPFPDPTSLDDVMLSIFASVAQNMPQPAKQHSARTRTRGDWKM